ncbi:hypothetical protein, partial [Streptomyces sp. AS58]|uniref:hypothetical protein n=1 Tax=Streptomyces sp. AS58 TaxID=1519489 RepID=UPI001F2AB7E9
KTDSRPSNETPKWPDTEHVYPYLVEHIKEYADNGACAVILTWEATGIGGSFLLLSGGPRLVLDPRVDTVYRRDVDDYVDFEWYLARILPAVGALGLTGYEISDLPY